MAVAVGFSVDVFVQNTANIDVDVFGRTFVVAPGWLLVAGVAALLVLLVGARCVAVGVGRARSRRRALRSAVTATKERDQLAQQLAVERAERVNAPDAAPATGPAETESSGGVVSTSN